MVRHQLERVQSNERIRSYLVDAVVWYLYVSFADVYRSSQQKTNKNAAQFITLASLLSRRLSTL